MDIVIKEQKGKVVFLTLNRPDKRNAMSTELVKGLMRYFLELREDDTVRVIILRANGNVFCSGADLSYLQQLQNNSYEENIADSSSMAELFALIYTHSKLIIAQVAGAALAGGCGLATVCDLCYATPESKFGYTEVKIGFIPAIVSFFLIRKIGESKAKNLLLSGNIVDANTAKHLNLINDVIDSELMEEHVWSLAEKIATETSPSSIELTKKLMSEIQSLNLNEAMQFAAASNAKARATSDCRKGIAAFLNKEKLMW